VIELVTLGGQEAVGHATIIASRTKRGWIFGFCATGSMGSKVWGTERLPDRARQLLTMEHMTGVCDGLLVECGESIGECDLGDACQALGSRDDYPAYRAAHGRVIDNGQSENQDEYGGEA
jgi:hypothetical protein